MKMLPLGLLLLLGACKSENIQACARSCNGHMRSYGQDTCICDSPSAPLGVVDLYVSTSSSGAGGAR